MPQLTPTDGRRRTICEEFDSSMATRVPVPDGADAGPVTPASGSGLRKRRLGRLVRFGFLALVVVFAAIWAWSNRLEVAQAWSRVTLVPVMLSLLAAAIATWFGVPAWRALLAGLGSQLRLRDAQRGFLMGQLGKYIPRGVWTVLAQATMGTG